MAGVNQGERNHGFPSSTVEELLRDRFHCLELLIGALLLTSAFYQYLYTDGYTYVFVISQSI
ncbi:hypothetical protein EJB05_20024, partial [Eragrostis curvula]